MFYRGLAGSRSHTRMPFLWRIINFYQKIRKSMWRILLLKDTHKTLGYQGRSWYRSYHWLAGKSHLFKQIITWTTSFSQSGWHILKVKVRWLNISKLIQNNHIFVFYNSIVEIWWLRYIGRICGVQTHLVIFYLSFSLFSVELGWNLIPL